MYIQWLGSSPINVKILSEQRKRLLQSAMYIVLFLNEIYAEQQRRECRKMELRKIIPNKCTQAKHHLCLSYNFHKFHSLTMPSVFLFPPGVAFWRWREIHWRSGNWRLPPKTHKQITSLKTVSRKASKWSPQFACGQKRFNEALKTVLTLHNAADTYIIIGVQHSGYVFC